jgi:hypothetical protein
MWRRKPRVNLLDTDDMYVFFQQLDHMDQGQLMGLRAAWNSVSPEEHADAWAAVRAVGTRDDLTKEIDRVRKKALAWTSRGTPVVPYVINIWQQVKRDAAEAIVDTALAISLGNRLDAHTHEILMGPWERALERAE